MPDSLATAVQKELTRGLHQQHINTEVLSIDAIADFQRKLSAALSHCPETTSEEQTAQDHKYVHSMLGANPRNQPGTHEESVTASISSLPFTQPTPLYSPL